MDVTLVENMVEFVKDNYRKEYSVKCVGKDWEISSIKLIGTEEKRVMIRAYHIKTGLQIQYSYTDKVKLITAMLEHEKMKAGCEQ